MAAGLLAGVVNSVAGGGSLLTFPTLVGLGFSPLVSNVTNTVGVSPGNLGGSFGFRRELRDQGGTLLRCGLFGAAGGLAGGLLLLATPSSALKVTIPVLIGVAALLILVQPRLARWLQARSSRERPHPWRAAGAVGAVAVYGGYFGAAMGVMLIAVLGLFAPDDLRRTNALKTGLTLIVNGVSALIFALRAPVAWPQALTLAAATTCGGYGGAALARRMPDAVLRPVIVAIGLGAAVYVALHA